MKIFNKYKNVIEIDKIGELIKDYVKIKIESAKERIEKNANTNTNKRDDILIELNYDEKDKFGNNIDNLNNSLCATMASKEDVSEFMINSNGEIVTLYSPTYIGDRRLGMR